MQYDVALNGWELGGGSVRIWKPDLLARSFNLQGYTREQMRERFGAMLEAFEYGAPPHGGIALGVDRWAALLSYQTNIREVMAFPKTQSGSDLMLEAPSAPDEDQYAGARAALRGGPRQARLTSRGYCAGGASPSSMSTVAAATCACCSSREIVATPSLGWPV